MRPSRFTIICPDSVPEGSGAYLPSIQFAASELRDNIRGACGVDLNIAYSDEDMVLATCPDGESGYLRQYDEIIIEGTDLYDGKNID